MGCRLSALDRDRTSDQCDGLLVIAPLRLEHAQHMQRVELILVVCKDRLVESLRFRKVAGLMR